MVPSPNFQAATSFTCCFRWSQKVTHYGILGSNKRRMMGERWGLRQKSGTNAGGLVQSMEKGKSRSTCQRKKGLWGVWFSLWNPNLVVRLRKDWSLNISNTFILLWVGSWSEKEQNKALNYQSKSNLKKWEKAIGRKNFLTATHMIYCVRGQLPDCTNNLDSRTDIRFIKDCHYLFVGFPNLLIL